MARAGKCVLDVLCGIYKNGLSGLSPDYFRGQAWLDLWPGVANVCYCHKFNNMLNVKLCDICLIKMEIIICIGMYDWHTMSQPWNMNYGITCLSNGWNYVNTCLNDVLT